MLKIKNMCSFYGESQIIRDLNLNVENGQICCLIGRNGVGKSTTLKSIMGLVKTPGGEIMLDGENLIKMPTYDRVKRGIGYVPQGREIFPQMTVLENLKLGLQPIGGKGEIPEYIFDLFPILPKFAKRKGGDLSGGQQQQLAIARALAAKPKILILDEPTEGIQPSIIQDIGRTVKRVNKKLGITVLIVEQYLQFVLGISDYIYVMEKGEIVMQGKTVMNSCECTYPFKITSPFYTENRARLMIMAASPGMLNGDKYDLKLTAESGAKIEITDQAYTKIFNTENGFAAQNLKITVGKNAELLWLPKPIIPYEGSSARFNSEIELCKSSMFVFCEIISCGRVGMGEKFKFKSFRSHTLVSVEGKPVFGDNIIFEPDNGAALDGIGFFEGCTHIGNLYAYGCKKPELPNAENITAFATDCLKGFAVRMSGFSGDSLYKFSVEIARNLQ